MSQNLSGTNIDYQTFKAEYDANPAIQNVIQRFDNQGVTLKTKEKEMPAVGAEKTSQVDSMAKRAAQKTMNR